jgi:hypothetical protein
MKIYFEEHEGHEDFDNEFPNFVLFVSFVVNILIHRLLQNCFRQLRSRQPGIIAFVFGEVLHAAEFFDSQYILRCLPVQPLGIDVQAARRLLRSSVVKFLSFAAEQPVEKYFCRVGVRRAFDDA